MFLHFLGSRFDIFALEVDTYFGVDWGFRRLWGRRLVEVIFDEVSFRCSQSLNQILKLLMSDGGFLVAAFGLAILFPLQRIIVVPSNELILHLCSSLSLFFFAGLVLHFTFAAFQIDLNGIIFIIILL